MKTEVISNSRNPVWNDDLKLLVHEPETQTLTVELRDWDLTVSDRIGRQAQLLVYLIIIMMMQFLVGSGGTCVSGILTRLEHI